MGKNTEVEKEIRFTGGSREDLREFPQEVRVVMGKGLREAQKGITPGISRPLPEFGAGVRELRHGFDKDAYRVVYLVRQFVLFVLHAFKKKSTEGKAIPKADKETINARLKAVRK